jgi:type I restriction enzyme M protein
VFFDRTGPTKEIWYYEQPLPDARRGYSKTQPMQFEEFADCLAWWHNRIENQRAWRVPAEQVLKYDGEGRLLSVNLDLRNPNGDESVEHLPPERLLDEILTRERKVLSLLEGIRSSLGESA